MQIPGIVHHALRHGISLVSELISRGADINSLPMRMSDVARRLADTILHRAVSYDDPELITILLDAGAQLNVHEKLKGDTLFSNVFRDRL